MSEHSNCPSEDELWESTRDADPRVRADALSRLADAASGRQEWVTAASLKAEEARILRDLSDPDYAIALTVQAMATSLAGLPAEALLVFDEALDEGRTSVSDYTLAEISSSKAELLEELGRSTEALAYLESARGLFASSGHVSRSGAMSIEKGMILARAWRFSEAEIAYEQAMHDFQVDGNSTEFARARDLLSFVLDAQGRALEAVPILRENVDLYTFLLDEDQAAYSRYRLGCIRLSLGERAEAFDLIDGARKHFLVHRNMVDRIGIEPQYIEALRTIGRISEAEDAARQLRAYYVSIGDERKLISIDSSLAQRALARGDEQFAVDALWAVILRADSVGYRAQERIARLLLAQYFAANDAIDQAVSALGNLAEGDWAENYSRRTVHLNVLAQIAFGSNELDHAGDLARKALELARLKDFHEQQAVAELTLRNIAEAAGDSTSAGEYSAWMKDAGWVERD